MPVNTQAITSAQVSVGAEPRARQVFSFPLTLVANTPNAVDLKTAANLHNVQNVQGIFVDNSAGTAPLLVYTAAGQNLQIPPGYQALMPLYLSADNVITFTGAGTINCTLLNFRTAAAVWPASSSGVLPVLGGLVQVSDVALDALVANGGLNVQNKVLGSGDVLQSMRGGVAYQSSQTGGTNVLIAGAPSVFVTGFMIQPSSTCTFGSTTYCTLEFENLTPDPVIWSHTYAATPGKDQIVATGLNLAGLLSGDNVRFIMQNSVTAGVMEVTIIGGTTAQA